MAATTTFALYAYLFAVTTLYAVILSRFPKLEPDLTWLEVVIGTALCLCVPALDQRLHGPLSGAVYEWRVWQAFIVGGTPIIAWRIGKSVRDWSSIFHRIFTRITTDGNTPDRTEALADQRRESAHEDD